ncbi:MAG: hypothetical protein AAGA70_09115 [Pseudomonadota bacterium]
MRRATLLAVIIIGAGLAIYYAQSVLRQPQAITISAATATPMAGRDGVLHVYLSMENGAEPNRLLSVSSAEAADAAFRGAVTGDLVLPADSTPSLSSDGVFIELTGVEGALEEGRLIPIALELAPAGTATTRALIGAPVDPHSMHAMATEQEAAEQGAGSQDHDMAGMNHDGDTMAPTLSMQVIQGDAGDWIVSVETTHFSFAPEVEEPVHVPGEGHGHLYLNGLKLQRVYSETTVIGALPLGQYTVEVTLNTNAHQPYENEAGPVTAQAVIEVE